MPELMAHGDKFWTFILRAFQKPLVEGKSCARDGA